jgi:hypothetical protein
MGANWRVCGTICGRALRAPLVGFKFNGSFSGVANCLAAAAHFKRQTPGGRRLASLGAVRVRVMVGPARRRADRGGGH